MVKIAVVDDNETWCFVLETFLQQHSFAVETFTSPHRFLPRAMEFDLVLIDFSMPARAYQEELEGPEVIAQLKSTLTNPPILILLSAYCTSDTEATILALCPEADACLSKQAGLRNILHQIQRLLPTLPSIGSTGLRP